MLKQLLFYVKYPAVAGIIGVVWIGTSILLINDHDLPIAKMVVINLVITTIIGLVGLRIDKN